jgi:hypothetical protein
LRFAFYVDKDGFERIDGFDKVWYLYINMRDVWRYVNENI